MVSLKVEQREEAQSDHHHLQSMSSLKDTEELMTNIPGSGGEAKRSVTNLSVKAKGE